MRILLDTHVLVWALIEPEKMPQACRAILNDSASQYAFSAVNIWEIAIKNALGRPDFDLEPLTVLDGARRTRLTELAVTSSAAARVGRLPRVHRDPFDRLLVAQALDEDMILVTKDEVLGRYGSNVLVLA